ncbi:Ig-like domain-containing protein [Halobacteria archaeon AArc-curdl1]|uniref:Ig-like domain-containing protein n=1 Tax=Natronosalvus hydrolyticus TaxID=2979988 RepID=A0AAP3E7F5_9EURY|nr:Ig-like domain-containing protein [Halobacteria archaeon AArc-curdl1]
MIRRGEERAVSTIIGAVLILGILVTALALYQVNVVPDDNRAVEYEHHQGVQSQLLDVRNGLVNAPDRRVGSYSVALGTTYPTRTFTINPPPSSGTLETVGENRTIRLENVEVEGGDVGDYWNERELEFNTSSLVYQPRYNEYRNAPTIVYENSVLYNEQNGGQAALSGQRLIDGNTIQLVLLEGEYSSSQSGTVAVDFETVSASSNTINLSATNNDNITIQVPSELNESVWNRLLDDGATASAGADGYVEIELDGNSYDLQIAKVGLGSNYQDGKDGEAYLTVVDPPRSTIQQGDSTRMTVEVRDGYNNPVSGVKVNGSTDGDGTLEPTSASSNSKGQVTFQYTAEEPDNDEVTLEANFTSNSSEYQRVTETIEVREGSSGGSGGGGTYTVAWDVDTIDGEPGMSCEGSACTFNLAQSPVDLTMNTTSAVSGANVDYSLEFVTLPGIATLSPSSGETDTNGEHVTTLSEDGATNDDVVRVHANSGGSGDTLRVEFEQGAIFDVTIDDSNSPVAPGEMLEVNVTVENTGSEEGTQNIAFDFDDDGTINDEENLTLGSGDSKQLTFTYDTTGEAEGEYDVRISSDDDTDVDTVTIGENVPYFDVQIDETNDPVAEGDTLEVTTTITNTGDVEDTQTIELDFEGGQVDSQEVTLAGGADDTVTLTYTTEVGDAGDREVVVSSEDDSDSTTVTVFESGGVNFTAGDVDVDNTSQTFTFDASPLGNNDEATIDLSDPQDNGGIDYSGDDVEVSVSGSVSSAEYDRDAQEIRFSPQGNADGTWTVTISGIEVVGEPGTSYWVEYRDNLNNEDGDFFQITD